MLALWAILAAEAVAVPPQMPALATSDLAAGSQQGAVIFRAFVDPRGKPMDCRPEAIAGADYSAQVCDKIMKSRFEPARDLDGKPIYGAIHTVANIAPPNAAKSTSFPVTLNPDMALKVKPIPGLVTSRVDVGVAVLIGPDGRIAACGADKGSSAKLAATACAQFRQLWSDTQLEDPEGAPRSYVRALRVSFEPEKP